MRIIFLSFGIVASVMPAASQLVIGPADMPTAGDILRYHTTPAAAVDIALAGYDVVWDMSDLQVGAPDADTAVAVSSTPFAYQLFFNNTFLYPEHAANFALPGTGFGVQGVSFSDVFDYYKKDATGYRNVGFGANLNGIPTSVRRVPVDYIHRFPLDYGDRDTSSSSFNVNVPTVGYYQQDQTRINHVDGWGTLVLPGNTFEVVRVRSVIQQRDSVYVDQFAIGFGTNRPQAVEYKWLAQGMDIPVLQVTVTGNQASNARFFFDPGSIASVSERVVDTGLKVWPNPARDHVQVANIPSGGVLVVHDVAGREVLRTASIAPGVVATIPLEGFGDGIYTVRSMMDAASTARFVVCR
jgi:hypothetical protein